MKIYFKLNLRFRLIPGIILLILFLFLLSGSVKSKNIVKETKLPPVEKKTKKYPLLVNYFHMNFEESMVSNKEERLAQWNILIHNPDDVKNNNISIKQIRKINPEIKILCWIPFGQEPHFTMAIAEGIPGDEKKINWYAKSIYGKYIKPRWGGHIMNPYKKNFAWPGYCIEFISKNYIENKLYDGILFDILSENAPVFASSDYPKTIDINEDGKYNENDNKFWNKGIEYLLKGLREKYPGIILMGNGGVPWTDNCSYFEFANGNMHENALGNEFGSMKWSDKDQSKYGLWEGMKVCMNPGGSMYKLERYHFVSVDVRYNRSQKGAEKLVELSENDLKRMRLGLTTCMLNDVYFSFDRGDCLHGQLWWFDEYDADIGQPVENYRKDKYSPGTYSREFKKGIVIVNPSSYNKIIKPGENYIDVTTKKHGNKFIIPANDGRILLRN